MLDDVGGQVGVRLGEFMLVDRWERLEGMGTGGGTDP